MFVETDELWVYDQVYLRTIFDNLDHKPTIHRNSTNTPQKVLRQIDLQENRGELCIEIQRERRSHLANNYGPDLW